MNWTKTSEQMPPEGEEVLAYSCKLDRQFIGWWEYYLEGTEWERKIWYMEGARGRNYAFAATVTHWMPKIENPKED